ncbi:MAG TPA: response regulator [Opitutaceae bacterium]|nr:response regulator [Opitutaceae bacterium]
MHLHPQGPRDGDQLIVGDHPIAALDLRNLRLIHFDAETRQTAHHVFLRNLRTGRDSQAVDVFAGDVASFASRIQGALEGAPILLLFPARIILYQNNRTLLIVSSKNQPLSILCVDNHTLVGDALAKVFRTAGYVVERAEDGESAWTKLTQAPGHFDVLVTDHEMPRLDGVGLVTRLREVGFAGRVIVYSAALSGADTERYRELGVDAIVVKSPDAARLLAIVQAFNRES